MIAYDRQHFHKFHAFFHQLNLILVSYNSGGGMRRNFGGVLDCLIHEMYPSLIKQDIISHDAIHNTDY